MKYVPAPSDLSSHLSVATTFKEYHHLFSATNLRLVKMADYPSFSSVLPPPLPTHRPDSPVLWYM